MQGMLVLRMILVVSPSVTVLFCQVVLTVLWQCFHDFSYRTSWTPFVCGQHQWHPLICEYSNRKHWIKERDSRWVISHIVREEWAINFFYLSSSDISIFMAQSEFRWIHFLFLLSILEFQQAIWEPMQVLATLEQLMLVLTQDPLVQRTRLISAEVRRKIRDLLVT